MYSTLATAEAKGRLWFPILRMIKKFKFFSEEKFKNLRNYEK
jgi:hypothetical protein